MSVKNSAYLNIPQFSILIIAGCAFFILYGETGLSPPFRNTAKNGGYLSATYR